MQHQALDTPHKSGTYPVAAAVIGNALEWFDYTCFGIFILPISRAFFPAGSEFLSLLLAITTFAIGFVVRPIGAVFIGYYADRAGRRAALTLIMFMMTAGTALLALIPDYAAIGILAPLAVVLARLIQGVSASGELGSSTAYLIEVAPPGRKCLYASFQMVGQFAATSLGVLSGALITQYLTLEQQANWGWRLPFLFGTALGPIGYYLRRSFVESDQFRNARSVEHLSVGATLLQHKTGIFAAFGLTLFATISIYVLIIYMPTYAAKSLGFQLHDSFMAVSVGALAGLVMSPVAGWMADRIGSWRVMAGAVLLATILIYPLFEFVSLARSPIALLVVQAILSALIATYASPALVNVAGLFGPSSRSTGLSVGYNLAVTLFGGFAPLITTGLISLTGDQLAPSYYVVAGGVATIGTMAVLRRRAGVKQEPTGAPQTIPH